MEDIKHVLIPKHEKLSQKDAKEFLETRNIQFMELPKILSSDPAIKEMGAKAGDIIKITRINKSGKTDFFRGVLDE